MTRFLSLAALLLGLAPSALAQSTAAAITFKNAGVYKPADLESIAGLHHGSSFTKDDLDKSAQALLDTGLFDDVQYLTNGTPAATNITYTLTPTASPLLPVQFTNFPWWTHAELAAALQSSIPIFNGSLPQTGSMRSTVQAALEKLLATKGITAIVTNLVAPPSSSHPDPAIDYSISSPTIQLHGVNLTGLTPDMTTIVSKLTALLIGQQEVESGVGSTEDNLVTAYHDAGYFDVTLTDVHRTISPLNSGIISIDFAATVQPSTVYRLSHFDLTAPSLLSNDEFQKLADLHPEDPAARYPLLASLDKLSKAYRHRGYLAAHIQQTPVIDAATHHVAYTVSINPGPQFHLHSVTPSGLSAQDTAKFLATFPMKPGEIYDGTLMNTFPQAWANQRPSAYFKNDRENIDSRTQTVDLIITFATR